ncbi:C2 domain-containing protein 3 [Physocladia obscura]|uniref:C2 domain-containing protein 3 n=1 Tax=Physocladia obscura TaxID=109957 RepID=A0AAD5XHD4_9FUNG|nr:C2 domain-containing protein 3 [Physocladia obscura]
MLKKTSTSPTQRQSQAKTQTTQTYRKYGTGTGIKGSTFGTSKTDIPSKNRRLTQKAAAHGNESENSVDDSNNVNCNGNGKVEDRDREENETLPPGVNQQAEVRFELRVSVARMRWLAAVTAVADPMFGGGGGPRVRVRNCNNSINSTSNNFGFGPVCVQLTWWGSQAGPACFWPPCVATRQSVTALNWTDAKTSITSTTTHAFPVRCPKQNLCAYLRDMGPLLLTVSAPNLSSKAAAHVRIPSLASVAADPYAKPLHAWLPIMATVPSSASRIQIGECCFSCVLVPFASSSVTSHAMNNSISHTNQSPELVRDCQPSKELLSSKTVLFDFASNTEIFQHHSDESFSKTDNDKKDDDNASNKFINNELYDAKRLETTLDDFRFVNSSHVSQNSFPDESAIELPQKPPEISIKPNNAFVFSRKNVTTNGENIHESNQTGLFGDPLPQSTFVHNKAKIISQESLESFPINNLQSKDSAFENLYSRAVLLKQQIGAAVEEAYISTRAIAETYQADQPYISQPSSTNFFSNRSNSNIFSKTKNENLYSAGNHKNEINEKNLNYFNNSLHIPSANYSCNKKNDDAAEIAVFEDYDAAAAFDGDNEFNDDDLIIEALNSQFKSFNHGQFLRMKEEKKIKDINDDDTGDVNESSDNGSTDDYIPNSVMNNDSVYHDRTSDSDENDDEYSHNDNDEDDVFVNNILNGHKRKAKFRNEFKEKNHVWVNNKQTNSITKPMISRNSQFFSLDTVTALGRVHSIRIYLNKLEAITAKLAPWLTTFVIDYVMNCQNDDTVGLKGEEFQQIGSKIVSSTLPRLANSTSKASFSQIMTPTTHGSTDCVVLIDKQDIYPVVFDGNMVEAWMQSSFDFNIVATQSPPVTKPSLTSLQAQIRRQNSSILNNSTKSLMPKKTLWEAHGSWKCREILINSDFCWTGRVPLFLTASNCSALTSATQKSLASKHIGDLILTVELIANPQKAVVVKIQEPPKRTSATKPSESSADPLSIASISAIEVTADQQATGTEFSPIRSSRILSLAPQYVFISITTARALAIFPSINSTSITSTGEFRNPSTTLVHLSLRLFNSTATTTPPIPYLPPFDLTTGQMNGPLNFDYSVTIPIAVTAEFLQNNRDTPLVVEVWSVSPSYPTIQRDSSGKIGVTSAAAVATESACFDPMLESGTEMVGEDGKHLLGLIRLPFGYLVSTMANMCLMKNDIAKGEEGVCEVVNEEGVGQISCADKPILLPETEYAIMDPFSGLSKGWVRAFLAVGNWGQIAKLQKGHVDSVKSPVRMPAPDLEEKKSILHQQTDQSRMEKEFSERIETENVSIHQQLSKSMKLGNNKGTVVLFVGIHGVCGLRSLLSETTKSNVDESIPIMDQIGQVETEATDTELLRWIRNGGNARGEIWHHATAQNQEELLLGTFKVPLSRLIERPNGMQGVWIPVFPSRTLDAKLFDGLVGSGDSRTTKEDENRTSRKTDTMFATAAVKLSVYFKNGMEFVEYEDGGINNNNYTGVNWGYRLKVCVEKLILAKNLCDFSASEGKQAGSLVSVRWKYPVSHGSEIMDVWISSESKCVDQSMLKNNVEYCVPFNEIQSVTLEMNAAEISRLRSTDFVIEILEQKVDKSYDIIGTAFVDVWDIVTTIRKSYRRKRNPVESAVVQGNFPVINTGSSDLGGSHITAMISLELYKKKDSVVSDEAMLNSKLPSAYLHSAPPKEFSNQNYISLKITIERAIQLPLIHNMPINSFVFFVWPKESADYIGMNALVTPTITSNSNPSWKFSFVANIPLEFLHDLKFGEFLVKLVVWHDPAASEIRMNTNILPDFESCTQIGTSSVDLSPLFTGYSEVFGWHQILGDNGISVGQILVNIEPNENFALLLTEISKSGSSKYPIILQNESIRDEAKTKLVEQQKFPAEIKSVFMSQSENAENTIANISSPNFLENVSLVLSRPGTPTIPQNATKSSPKFKNESFHVAQNNESASATAFKPTESVSENVHFQTTDMAIENFSKSLQKTVDELNTLQEMIRNRGIKSVQLSSRDSKNPPNQIISSALKDNKFIASSSSEKGSGYDVVSHYFDENSDGNIPDEKRENNITDSKNSKLPEERLRFEDLDFEFESEYGEGSNELKSGEFLNLSDKEEDLNDFLLVIEDDMGERHGQSSKAESRNLSASSSSMLPPVAVADQNNTQSKIYQKHSSVSNCISTAENFARMNNENQSCTRSIWSSRKQHPSSASSLSSLLNHNMRQTEMRTKAATYASLLHESLNAPGDLRRKKTAGSEIIYSDESDDGRSSSNSSDDFNLNAVLSENILFKMPTPHREKLIDLSDLEQRYRLRRGDIVENKSNGEKQKNLRKKMVESKHDDEDDESDDTDYSLIFGPTRPPRVPTDMNKDERRETVEISSFEREQELVSPLKDHTTASNNKYREDLEIQEILEKSRRTRAEALLKKKVHSIVAKSLSAAPQVAAVNEDQVDESHAATAYSIALGEDSEAKKKKDKKKKETSVDHTTEVSASSNTNSGAINVDNSADTGVILVKKRKLQKRNRDDELEVSEANASDEKRTANNVATAVSLLIDKKETQDKKKRKKKKKEGQIQGEAELESKQLKTDAKNKAAIVNAIASNVSVNDVALNSGEKAKKKDKSKQEKIETRSKKIQSSVSQYTETVSNNQLCQPTRKPWNDWSKASFEDEETKAKFLKFMGVGKKKSEKSETGTSGAEIDHRPAEISGSEKSALNQTYLQKMQADLEKQYETARSRQFGGGFTNKIFGKRAGLG